MTGRETVNRPALYTEKSTDLIYEVQLFDKYAVVRPVSPAFIDVITKMSLQKFGQEFEEYSGLHETVYSFLEGREGDLWTTRHQ